MSQFLYLYRMTGDARQAAMGTPEQAQQIAAVDGLDE